MKGGSPPKKRHTSSLPPFALHLKYEPRSGSDWKRSCGMTPTLPLPPDGDLLIAASCRYVRSVGLIDASAPNPGIFIATS